MDFGECFGFRFLLQTFGYTDEHHTSLLCYGMVRVTWGLPGTYTHYASFRCIGFCLINMARKGYSGARGVLYTSSILFQTKAMTTLYLP